ALLSILGPPVITAQPASLSVTNESSASLSVSATGTAPLSYQWRLNAANVSGEINSMLAIINARTSNAGSYTVSVSNGIGSVTSLLASLTVLTPPSIITQPTNQSVHLGSNALYVV